jgi:hypothetical protein
MGGDAVLAVGVEAKGIGAGGDQVGGSDGVSTGEERHVVALADEFFGKVRNHAFRSAVRFRGYAFMERRNLGNSHATKDAKQLPTAGIEEYWMETLNRPSQLPSRTIT